ncbi:type II toxin-antitoxin system ParD family antitoxin [Mycetocola tolaasinivorans]|uniref:Type II toxin-antitoxin system ParD family antitoxin n=1 Tax=Mycetocola tolaasinivorans TaxID=76635 RepID=A0A3L7AA18_9MICO|nr:type II toxin-antitoxin system ParD family antitoxin [Mycetocola tolaasinivorans]RLP77286.1 type II toxin-antitoxin system ParD family antitoxin [Mycetocola tolaasinivorans]
MASMNISLTESLKDFVESQVGDNARYGNASEFMRDLIRREQARTEFRTLILEGAASGTGSELNDAYFDRLHARITDARDAS